MAGADIVVTTSGARYEGSVTKEGDRYIIITADGGRMALPASMVTEVIEQEGTPEISPEAAARAKRAVSQMRGELAAAARALVQVTEELEARHSQEGTLPGSPGVAAIVYRMYLGEVEHAAENLALLPDVRRYTGTVGKMGTPRPNGTYEWTYWPEGLAEIEETEELESECTFSEDAQGVVRAKMVVVVTRETVESILKDAQDAYDNAQGPGRRLQEQQLAELNACTQVENGLASAEAALTDARRDLAALGDTPEQFAEALQGYEADVDAAVSNAMASIARLREGNEQAIRALQAPEPGEQEPVPGDDTPTAPDDRTDVLDSGESDQCRDSEANRRVYEQLQNEQSFEFEGMALEDVVQYISEAAGVDILVNWQTLNAAGVDRNSEVNIIFTMDVTVGKALQVILQDVGGVDPPLCFYVSEGVITITTQPDLYKHGMETRVYDIRDLVTARLADGPSRERIIVTMIDDIMSLVDESSWDEGTITEHDGQLIIKQTREHHLIIGSLLTRWRDARDLR